MPKFNMNWIYLLAIASLFFFYFSGEQGLAQRQSGLSEVSYSEFKTLVNRGNASRIVVNKSHNTLKMYVKPDSIRSVFNKTADQVGTDPYLAVEFGSIERLEQFVDSALVVSVMSATVMVVFLEV